MLIIVLLTSFILLIIGCIGLVKSSTLVKTIISIEIITLASILNLLYYPNDSNSDILMLIVIIISEINIAILFIINNKLNSNKWLGL